jgi:hypothetical protein
MFAMADIASSFVTYDMGGASEFSFGYIPAQNTSEINAGIETMQEKQLIVDIAIAGLQMDSGYGLVCSDHGIKIPDSQNYFISPSAGANTTEKYYSSI